MTKQSAEQLANMQGTTLSNWIHEGIFLSLTFSLNSFLIANQRDFRPTPLQTTFQQNMTYTVRYLTGYNVIGYLGPREFDETIASVIVMAHHDHLGIRPSPYTNGRHFVPRHFFILFIYDSDIIDSIYNGAIDNASGVSALLASAYLPLLLLYYIYIILYFISGATETKSPRIFTHNIFIYIIYIYIQLFNYLLIIFYFLCYC